jgi:hypothetical protein
MRFIGYRRPGWTWKEEILDWIDELIGVIILTSPIWGGYIFKWYINPW